MVKKLAFGILIFLLFTITSVFAGDIPESIMLGEQKALFIGEITDSDTDLVNIKPLTIMMGNIEENEIQVKRFNKYYGTKDKPKVGDFVVVVLEEDNKINELWIFKSTSKDYKTLELVSEKHDMVERYQKYINEGKYFEAQRKIEDKEKEATASTNFSNDNKEIRESNYEDKTDKSLLINNRFMITILIIISIIFGIFIVKR